MELVLGCVTGALFGLLLQKAGVLRFEKQVGFLLFRDVAVLQFMISAVLVGSVGLYICKEQGLIEFRL
ncbi:MAG: YeeE/YedE family protein, partial [Kiritimatiellia bacterium]